MDQARTEHAHDLGHHECMPLPCLVGRNVDVIETRSGFPALVSHQFHEQHAFVNQVGRGNTHPCADQTVQGIHLGILPFRFLHPTAVAAALSHGTRVATVAGLTSLLVLGKLVKAPLLGFLVNLGAANLVASGDDVHRRFLAALELANDGVNHAVFDQRLQAFGYFHAVRA